MAGLTKEQRAAKAAVLDTDTIAQVEDPAVRLAVLERRLADPFGVPAAPVRLKDTTMFPRWFNNSIMHDRFWTAQNQGWQPVKPEDIVDLNQIGNYGQSPEGYITRGERGNEMLMCIPRDFWNRLQLAKTKKNNELTRDTSKQSAQALEAAAQALGPEVAEQMRGVQRKVEITDNYERVERTPDLE